MREAGDGADLPPCDSRFHYVPPWRSEALETLAEKVVPAVAGIAARYAAAGRPDDLITADETATLVGACAYVRLRGDGDGCTLAFGGLPSELTGHAQHDRMTVRAALECVGWFDANQRLLTATGITPGRPGGTAAADGALYGPELARRYDPARQVTEQFNDVLRGFAKEFLGMRRVLELGTGTGRVARNIAPFAGSYVGIEASRAMIDAGRRDGLDVRQGDMMAMPFETGSVDVVVEHESVDFCTEPLLAATEIERVLALGGQFYRIELETVPAAGITRLQDEITARLAKLSGGVFPYWTKGQRRRLHSRLTGRGFAHRRIRLARWHETRTLRNWLQGLVNASYPSFSGVDEETASSTCVELARAASMGDLDTKWPGEAGVVVHQYEAVEWCCAAHRPRPTT
ncbi:class I SAM-dependent methyltransferase [Streptomyces sp. SID7499]|uniref:Class I SAM-dependent methyltransferase n=1 Tax=Streptomyces sp. SID7499 TaxID=2706086 RepID=A0A6G3X8M1_9ACTN|nr:class I SAM-dependent methyltransferase [Streptomyces sp. SID7499]